MEGFVQHVYELEEPSYDLPLLHVKYIIDIVSSLILFTFQEDTLHIHTINGTELSVEMYSYYMQFRMYPMFQTYLKHLEMRCRQFHLKYTTYITSYPETAPQSYRLIRNGDKISYEDLKRPLEEYYNITKDPRQLISIDSQSNSITYVKETWSRYLSRLQPECYDRFKKVKQTFSFVATMFMNNDQMYTNLMTYLRGNMETWD